MITVTIKTDAMKRALAKFAEQLEHEASEALSAALFAAGAEARANISRQTKRHTGRLLEGTKIQQATAYTGRLFSSAPYAGYVDAGTRAHTIAARRAKTLAFTVGGKRVFRRTVHHPGTTPRPFVAPAAHMGESVLQIRLQHSVNHLAATFGR